MCQIGGSCFNVSFLVFLYLDFLGTRFPILRLALENPVWTLLKHDHINVILVFSVNHALCIFQAQIGELQKMLESMPSLEKEVQALRAEKSAFERDMELSTSVQRQRSGGLWKWVAGS